MQTRGLTLVEIILVVAIVVLLAALAVPVVHRARYRAHDATCLSNMRQILSAIMMYRADYNQAFPPKTRPILAYTKNEQVFHCPVDTLEYERQSVVRLLGRLQGIPQLSYLYFGDTGVEEFLPRYAPPHDENYGILVCFLHPISNLSYRSPDLAPFVRRGLLDGSVVTVRKRPPNPDERVTPPPPGEEGVGAFNVWVWFTNAPCPPEYCRRRN